MGGLVALAPLLAGLASAEEVQPVLVDWGPPLHDYHDVDGGLIDPLYECDNASQGTAVAGFDTPGEWIEVLFDLAEGGRFDVELSFKSGLGVANSLVLSFRPAGGEAGDPLDFAYAGAGLG